MVPYSVAFRVFNLILVFFGVMAQPIWSDMASSFAMRDSRRICIVHRKYLTLAVIASVGTIVIGLFINLVLAIWLGQPGACTFVSGVGFPRVPCGSDGVDQFRDLSWQCYQSSWAAGSRLLPGRNRKISTLGRAVNHHPGLGFGCACKRVRAHPGLGFPAYCQSLAHREWRGGFC